MKKNSKRKKMALLKGSELQYLLMLLPGTIFLLIFSYMPMTGIIMAFENFKPAKGIFGSDWVGLYHFKVLFESPMVGRVFRNTLVIALGKIVLTSILGIVFAILLNEIRVKWLKKGVQTIVYLPHFLSWVVLASVVTNMFRLTGSVNSLLEIFNIEPINFLGSNDLFQPLLIGTHIWKEFGYSSIVYLAAITTVDPNLHEAAAIDGASWWKRVWHVTLPAMVPIILLMAAINISTILSAGFDQVYNLYSEIVYETGDILDTYVYRASMIEHRYSFGTAVGLLKSVIGMVLLLSTNWLSRKFAHRSIF